MGKMLGESDKHLISLDLFSHLENQNITNLIIQWRKLTFNLSPKENLLILGIILWKCIFNGEKNVAIMRLELKEVNGRKEFFLFGKNYFYSIKIIILPFMIIIII